MREDILSVSPEKPYQAFWENHRRRQRRSMRVMWLALALMLAALFFGVRYIADVSTLRMFARTITGFIFCVAMWLPYRVYKLQKELTCPRCGQLFFGKPKSAQDTSAHRPESNRRSKFSFTAPVVPNGCVHCGLLAGAEFDDDTRPLQQQKQYSALQLAFRVSILPIVCLKGVVIGIALSNATVWWKPLDALSRHAIILDHFIEGTALCFCVLCAILLVRRKMPESSLALAKTGSGTALAFAMTTTLAVLGKVVLYALLPIARREDTWAAWFARCDFSHMHTSVMLGVVEVCVVGALAEVTVAALGEAVRDQSKL